MVQTLYHRLILPADPNHKNMLYAGSWFSESTILINRATTLSHPSDLASCMGVIP